MHDEQPTSVSESKTKKQTATLKPPPLPREEKPPTLTGEFRYVKLAQLVQDPHNVRRIYDDIDEFAAAIREDGGILNPLVVRSEGEAFLIIAGHRRYLAAQKLALDEVPVRLVNVTDEEKDALQVSENINRSDVPAIDLAQRLRRMIERFPQDDAARVEKVAQRLSRSPNLVRRYLALLKLEPRVVKALERNRLGITQAMEVVKLARAEKVPEAIELASAMRGAPAKRANEATTGGKQLISKPRRVFEIQSAGITVRVTASAMQESEEAAFRTALEKFLAAYGGVQ